MSLTVKAFLRKPGSSDPPQYEIRRFGVDADVSTSFIYLQQKISAVYPSLANRTVELFWRDSENDLIAFSSDDELTEALTYVTDGVFKVYIEQKGSSCGSSAQTSSENTRPGFSCEFLHPHVTCDGCNGAVIGTRYKCTTCPDYDLCSTCKGQGLHSEHQMRAIERPVPGPFMPPFGVPPSGPPPCFFPPPPSANMPPPSCFPFDPIHGRDAMRMQRRAWRRWMKSYGADPCRLWKKERKEEKKDEKKEEKRARKAEKKARKEKERAEKAGEAQEGAEKMEKDSSSSSSSSDEEASPTGDYLHSVGQSVAAMLDPLGIDVEIDVEHKGRRKHCHRGFPGGPWGFHMRGFGGGRGGWGRGRGGFCQFGGPFAAYSSSQASAQATASQGPAAPPPQYPEAQPPQYPDYDANSETGELRSGFQTPGCCATAEPFQKEAPVAEKNSSSPEPSGWTLVVEEGEADIEGAAKGVEKLLVTGEGTAGGNSQPPSMDAKLIEALEQMMVMGYTDDDGWLTTLLVDNNYDIGLTLDAIKCKK